MNCATTNKIIFLLAIVQICSMQIHFHFYTWRSSAHWHDFLPLSWFSFKIWKNKRREEMNSGMKHHHKLMTKQHENEMAKWKTFAITKNKNWVQEEILRPPHESMAYFFLIRFLFGCNSSLLHAKLHGEVDKKCPR